LLFFVMVSLEWFLSQSVFLCTLKNDNDCFDFWSGDVFVYVWHCASDMSLFVFYIVYIRGRTDCFMKRLNCDFRWQIIWKDFRSLYIFANHNGRETDVIIIIQYLVIKKTCFLNITNMFLITNRNIKKLRQCRDHINI